MNDADLEKIQQVLDEKVRPSLAVHAGDVVIDRLEGGKLYVRMTGACAGCPSAQTDIEEIVGAELKAVFPELEDVILQTGVSDSLIEEARQMLRRRHREG